MVLNKAKGHMFKSVGWTWNPCAGCTHNCIYCWAKMFNDRYGVSFEPMFRERFLQDKFPNDGTWIFVCSTGDMFCDGMKKEWIEKIINHINSTATNNKFLLQSKNPSRILEFKKILDFKDRYIVGTTLETTRCKLDWTKAPSPFARVLAMVNLKRLGFKTFLSLEPLADFEIKPMTEWIWDIEPEAIEIGLENYGNLLPKPSETKIKELLSWLDLVRYPYVLKENLKHLERNP